MSILSRQPAPSECPHRHADSEGRLVQSRSKRPLLHRRTGTAVEQAAKVIESDQLAQQHKAEKQSNFGVCLSNHQQTDRSQDTGHHLWCQPELPEPQAIHGQIGHDGDGAPARHKNALRFRRDLNGNGKIGNQMYDQIYGLSDTAKAFLIILFTDVFVGFHSTHGWEVILENGLRHFGLPENRDLIFLFIATFPVLLDTVFKYWIFRYLNQVSPSAVATYHEMNE